MPVLYEELAGSPTIELNKGDITGTRRVKIAWSDITNFANEIFPDPFLTGYLYGAYLPGFPWAIATGIKVKPFVDTLARYNIADWTAWYDWAEVEVSYGVPKWENTKNTGNGPEGKDMQDIPFYAHKVHCGGEFITFPAKSTAWQVVANANVVDKQGADLYTVLGGSTLLTGITDASTTIVVKGVALPQQKNMYLVMQGMFSDFSQVTAVALNKNNTGLSFTVVRGASISGAAGVPAAFPVGTQVQFVTPTATTEAQVGTAGVASSVIVPMIEHTLEWDFVQNPPWAAIRSTMGKVNATAFAGMPAETGLFLGAEASQQVTITGLKPWKLSYKISEKNQNAADPKNPMGWNHFMRPNGDSAGQFQRLVKTVPFVFGVGGAGGAPSVKIVQNMNATQQFMKVANTGPPLPQQGQFSVTIGDEIIIITGIITAGSPGVYGCIRGCSGTTAAAHAAANAKLGFDVTNLATQIGTGVYDSANFSYLFPGF